jgi:hypothetical protein
LEALITTKLHNRFDCVCTLGTLNKFNISHAPRTGLSGTQFSTLNSAGINDPEGQEKYNKIEVKYGQLFTPATQHLTPADVKYKNLETKCSLGSINQNNIHENCRLGLTMRRR